MPTPAAPPCAVGSATLTSPPCSKYILGEPRFDQAQLGFFPCASGGGLQPGGGRRGRDGLDDVR